ncbi:MAG: NUDIX hydrolase [Hyphomicrobium sp.]|nr:MAG: NUDIX hydrolase [Hyphomicrobium sp.]
MPYALHKKRVTFLLITSRRSGRWIFPKGSMIDGQQPWETAALEAFEEAGVEGNIGRQLIGTYRTIKKGPMVRKVVEVDMYPLLVTHQHTTWAEMKSRHRHWVLLPEAKRLLSDPVLAGLAKELGQSLVASHYPDTAVINI